MKTQLKIFFFSFLICCSGIITSESAAPPMPTGHTQPMPSVGDIFGNLSQEQIIEQVQEAQKFFESLSPEEMAEVEKMVEDTLKNMSDQDFQDIQQIATMVEPHLDTPQQQESAKEATTPTPKDTEKAKKVDEVDVDTNNIQQLIDSINNHVNDIFQKAESSKELAEEVNHKWTSLLTFNNMNKQILSLKENRLAKKLAKKENKEDQELVEALQSLQADISKHNKSLKVEDTFGVPESRQIEQKQLSSLQGILSMLDGHIDKVMPLTEKFLKKHDPEALELAKESEERAKKAKQHAKDAEVKTGFVPKGSPDYTRGSAGSYPYPGNNQPHSEGGYIGTAGGEGIDNYPSQLKANEQKGLGKNPSKESGKAKEKKSSTESNQIALSPYQEVSNFFEDHIEMFDNKHETDFLTFLQDEITKYPNPAKASNPPSNPAERSEWLTNEFSNYTNNAKQKANKFAREFKAVNDSLENNLKSISKIPSEQELQKLSDHKDIKKLKSRLQKYKEAYEKAQETINNVFQQNTAIDGNQAEPIKGPATLSEYKHQHRDFTQSLQTVLGNPLVDAESTIDTIERKIKHQKRRLKNKV